MVACRRHSPLKRRKLLPKLWLAGSPPYQAKTASAMKAVKMKAGREIAEIRTVEIRLVAPKNFRYLAVT